MTDLNATILAGMSDTALRTALASLQKALIDLSLGQKAVTVSYTQGNGARSVSYGQTDSARITAQIVAIQTQLGIGRGRRPIHFRF
ncbi:phage head-tail adapter protein [Azospirillum cavernae]|uniref:Phage head-tail adapter protein n=1 Tax=Azospirillum cavernae TaxID=2320860 RepID=A0A418VWZ3_9PROT|nr:gpW family head-tail joining protein [Azospirillum cavernae]RJF81662.1 phage head-tail adapter protein [Azospirillum cavernae]